MNLIIEKILQNILLISNSKFTYLLKVDGEKYSILSSYGDIENFQALIDDFNLELIKTDVNSKKNFDSLKAFKKLSQKLKIKDCQVFPINNNTSSKILLSVFAENKFENGALKNIEDSKSILESLLTKNQLNDQNKKINEIDLAILETDVRGKIISYNTAFQKIFEIEPTNENNDDFGITFYDGDDNKIELEKLPFKIAADKNENVFENKLKYFLADGSFKWFKVNSNVSKDDNGKAKNVISFFWDVSDIMEVEERVEETTKNIESVLYSTGPDSSKFYFVTDAVKKMFGYTPEEIYTKRYAFLRKIYPEYLAEVRNFINELAMGKKSVVEYKFKDNSGFERKVRHTGTPIIENGDVMRVVGVIYDITEQNRIMEELEKSEEKFRVLIETANDLIFSLDSSGYFQMVNKSGALSLGYNSNEMIGKHFLEFVEDDNKADVALAFQKIVTTEEITFFEVTFLDKFGSNLIFEIQARPTKIEDEISGMIAIGRNVTARRNDEQKLKDLNAKLIEANRINQIERDRAKHQISVLEELNKLKNEFISNVSHELRTPLASIVGFAETMASDEDLPRDAISEFNSIILTEGKRLAKFINEVLDFSKLESDKGALEKTDFDIVPVLNNLFDNYKDQVEEKGITLSKQIPEAEIILHGDKARISSSISKLISNAIKFTNADGRVTLIVQDFLKEVEIIISDTGIGIPEKEIPNLFQKFRKVNRPGTQLPGAGFGLVTVKQIVDLHKGLVQVKSEENKGTTFVIRLPKNN